MKSGIYKITNSRTGRFYIGSSYDVYNRWRKHQEKLKINKHPNIHLQRAWNLDSEHFLFSVIELVSLEQLLIREQYYIDILKPNYNIALVAGSSLGVKRSTETIEKIRASTIGKKQSPETVAKRAEKLRGKKRTKDQREKLRETKMGDKNPIHKHGYDKQIEAMRLHNTGTKRPVSVSKSISKALSIPIIQLSLNGEFIKEWESATQVERELGWANSNINRVCSGKTSSQGFVSRTAYGYKWLFKENYNNNDNKTNNNT